ncbi:acetyl-CoA carboxylase carboxyltransferase subunit alpha [Calditrichota bacterium]
MKDFILDFEKPIRDIELKIAELEAVPLYGKVSLNKELERLRKKADKVRESIYSDLSGWQHVQLARHPNRLYTLDYLELIAPDFLELHGDRNFRDDEAIVSGLAHIDERRVAIIGHQKGRGTKDNLKRNFGMPNPEGYRKALRIMSLAEKFNLPVITFIDTPGAYPGLGAEERGQAAAIADNLVRMSNLKVPIITIIIGEGGSGGALALAVADKVFMLKYAVYSVITAEGCASILYRDATKASSAANSLKLTATDLMELTVIDDIIPEPMGGCHKDPESVASAIRERIFDELSKLEKMTPADRIDARILKYSKMGRWLEKG